MTKQQLVEYINAEKRLRGVCFAYDPRTTPILKKYYLSEKYLNKPLWGISAANMQVVGVMTIESFHTEFSDIGEVSHYRWKVGEFHPINPFVSPFKRPVKAPTISFACPNLVTEELFQKIQTFKTFLG